MRQLQEHTDKLREELHSFDTLMYNLGVIYDDLPVTQTERQHERTFLDVYNDEHEDKSEWETTECETEVTPPKRCWSDDWEMDL